MAMSRGGARLAYVVIKIEADVEREIVEWVDPKSVKAQNVKGSTREDRRKVRNRSGLVRKMIKQPGGYMVYFPRGHAVRFRDEDHLAQYGLDQEPDIINMQGLHSKNSPVGKLLRAQDDKARKGAFESLEKQVIQLATARSGPVIMPEQLTSRHAVPDAA